MYAYVCVCISVHVQDQRHLCVRDQNYCRLEWMFLAVFWLWRLQYMLATWLEYLTYTAFTRPVSLFRLSALLPFSIILPSPSLPLTPHPLTPHPSVPLIPHPSLLFPLLLFPLTPLPCMHTQVVTLDSSPPSPRCHRPNQASPTYRDHEQYQFVKETMKRLKNEQPSRRRSRCVGRRHGATTGARWTHGSSATSSEESYSCSGGAWWLYVVAKMVSVPCGMQCASFLKGGWRALSLKRAEPKPLKECLFEGTLRDARIVAMSVLGGEGLGAWDMYVHSTLSTPVPQYTLAFLQQQSSGNSACHLWP